MNFLSTLVTLLGEFNYYSNGFLSLRGKKIVGTGGYPGGPRYCGAVVWAAPSPSALAGGGAGCRVGLSDDDNWTTFK